MGRSPGGNCFLRRIGRDKPDRAVMLYDDKTKERSTNTFYYQGVKAVYGNMRVGIDSKYRSRGRIDRRMQPGGNALIRSMLAQVVGA